MRKTTDQKYGGLRFHEEGIPHFGVLGLDSMLSYGRFPRRKEERGGV